MAPLLPYDFILELRRAGGHMAYRRVDGEIKATGPSDEPLPEFQSEYLTANKPEIRRALELMEEGWACRSCGGRRFYTHRARPSAEGPMPPVCAQCHPPLSEVGMDRCAHLAEQHIYPAECTTAETCKELGRCSLYQEHVRMTFFATYGAMPEQFAQEAVHAN